VKLFFHKVSETDYWIEEKLPFVQARAIRAHLNRSSSSTELVLRIFTARKERRAKIEEFVAKHITKTFKTEELKE